MKTTSTLLYSRINAKWVSIICKHENRRNKGMARKKLGIESGVMTERKRYLPPVPCLEALQAAKKPRKVARRLA